MAKGSVWSTRQRHRRFVRFPSSACPTSRTPGPVKKARSDPQSPRGRPDPPPHRAGGAIYPDEPIFRRQARYEESAARNRTEQTERRRVEKVQPPIISSPSSPFSPSYPSSRPLHHLYLHPMPRPPQKLLDELHHRQSLAEQGGGAERVAQQQRRASSPLASGSTCCSMKAAS